MKETGIVKQSFAYLILAVILASGCSDNYGSTVFGSCDAGIASDHSKMCIDYYDDEKLSEWRSACTMVMRGKWSETACNTESALGGCQPKNGKAVIWLYPSARHQSMEEVEASCTKQERLFLLPAK